MKSFARLTIASALAVALVAPAFAQTWSTDYAKTMQEAKKSGRLTFAFFTGSDWCGPCMEMKRTIINTDTFRTFARSNLHLLEVDFPQQKVLPKAVARQNEALQNTFRVTGYPTVLLITPEGRVFARLGFGQRTTPKSFVENLDQLVKRYNSDRAKSRGRSTRS